MSSRAHSFCKLENRLPGPGATASLVCQILSWSLEPNSPASPYRLRPGRTQARAHRHTRGGPGLWLFREHTHMHTYPDTHIYPDVSAYWCAHLCTQIYHGTYVHGPCQLHVHMFACRSTYLNVCNALAHTCIHRHLSLYIHVCTQVQTCLHTQTHLHTTAHPHIHRHKTAHVHTDGIHNHVHTFAYRTTCKDLNARTCLLHTVYTQSHRLLTVSAQQP